MEPTRYNADEITKDIVDKVNFVVFQGHMLKPDTLAMDAKGKLTLHTEHQGDIAWDEDLGTYVHVHNGLEMNVGQLRWVQVPA